MKFTQKTASTRFSSRFSAHFSAHASHIASLSLAAAAMLFSGCNNCDDGEFNPTIDAGPPPVPDAGPPPPVFPLKAGDVVVFNGLGGRIEPCDGAEGSCERTMKATYTINSVELDEEINRWGINADVLYELAVGNIEQPAMSRLFVSRTAPFESLVAGGAENTPDVDFTTDGAFTDEMVANNFPFFHFEAEYALQEGSAYATASDAFTARVQAIDPSAEIENQPAERKFEAYFKDELGDQPLLHKIRVSLHPFGFVCALDERTIPFTEGMGRNEGSFAGQTIPLAAVFPGQVQLVRGDTRYTCSCFNLQCKTVDGSNLCLDPTDPDAPAATCP